MKKIATLVLILIFFGMSSQSQAHERNNIVPALIGAAIITSVIANSQQHYVQPQRYEYQYPQYPNQVYYAPQVPQTYYVPQPVYQPNTVIIYSSNPYYEHRYYREHEREHHEYRHYDNDRYNGYRH